MNKRYRLGEIEEAVSDMEELIGLEDDIAEIDDEFQIVVSGWSVYVESLNLTFRQGIACVWDAEEGLFMGPYYSNRGGGVGCDHEGPPDSWHTACGGIVHYRHLQHCPSYKGEDGAGHGK